MAAAIAALLASGASASTYRNGSQLTTPDDGPASIYPSPITVTGLPGGVVKVTASVNGIFHPLGHELDALLVAPNGASSILFSDVCGQPDPTGGMPFNGNFTFDDTASEPLTGGPVCSTGGTFRPSDGVPGDAFPAPAPPGPHTAAMSNFIGGSANGTWQLFIRDQATGFCPGCPPGFGGQGVVRGGWSLDLLPEASCGGQRAVLGSHVGTGGDDQLSGTPGDDVIIGLGGNDEIESGGGNDIVCGGAGKDVIRGERGKDTIRGGPGGDRLRGGRGKDSLRGGKSKDTCSGGKGKDKLFSC